MGARYELSCANEPLILAYIDYFWGTTPYASDDRKWEPEETDKRQDETNVREWMLVSVLCHPG